MKYCVLQFRLCGPLSELECWRFKFCVANEVTVRIHWIFVMSFINDETAQFVRHRC
jgi:hypothetical protein